MQLIEDRDDEYQGAFSDDGSVEAMKPGASWNELADQQRADRETAQINANQKRFDDMMAIEIGSKRKIAINQQNRRIDCATAMESASNNGGLSDRSLSDALSMSFGRPTYGGQWVNLGDEGTAFVLYGAGRDRQGNAAVVPIAMMNNLQSLQLLQSAKLGDRTQKLRESLYKEVAAKYRPDQLESMGIQNPSAPISIGTTVISGAAMRALRGTPRQRNMEGGHFAADGRGGFTKSYFNRSTGENWEANYGTRDPARRAAKWKVLESHADYTRYENDLTGEVVKVAKGENLRDVIQRGGSEKERIAQMNNESRERIATAKGKSAEEVAKVNGEYKQQIAKIVARAKENAQTNGKITGSDIAALLKVANDPLASDEVRKSAIETASLLQDRLNGAANGDGQPTAQGGEKKDDAVSGDEDITLPDGSQGKKHNGKTYRLKGTDKDGNKQWELVK